MKRTMDERQLHELIAQGVRLAQERRAKELTEEELASITGGGPGGHGGHGGTGGAQTPPQPRPEHYDEAWQ